MCILFAYVADSPKPDSYKVIIAVNRDEQFKRPTKKAEFWGTKPDVLGGRDMEPGREGGTWFGMSVNGKIAALLNVLQSKQQLATAGDRRGRGFLVSNFLTSSVNAIDYMTEIHKTSTEFNPFTLFTIDVLYRNVPQICYYSCANRDLPIELPAGRVHGIGNSYIETPFLKVKSGKEAFTKVIQEHNLISKKEDLIQGILNVMKSEEKFHPDPQLLRQAPDQPEIYVREMSRRFIRVPGYGTRTHTVILIDYNNKVCYKELTLTEPISHEGDRHWTESEFDFTITENL